MNKKLSKFTSLLIVSSVLVSLLGGCGNKENTEATKQLSTNQAENTEQTAGYPMKTDVKLTYWLEADANVTSNFKNLGDTPFAKELQKKTGVEIEFIHPVAGQAAETMNLMIASNDLPDIMEHSWLAFYDGGPELALQNKVIIELTDLIKNNAPNLNKYLSEHPDLDKMIKTDSGKYYTFPNTQPDDMLVATYGPVIREDWLKELNLESPNTLDDWYNVLKAFKEKKGATAPLSYYYSDRLGPFKRGVFSSAFGMLIGFYKDENNKVKFGPTEPEYKDFLETMRKWYKEGLLDNNFAMNDLRSYEANIVSGKTGATICYPGSGIGKYNPILMEKDPNAKFVATTYPILKDGDKMKICIKSAPFAPVSSASISGQCKYPEIAAQFLDYGYSEEGSLLFNFGIEGVSYKMENNYPKMLDEVLKNPDGLPIEQAWAKYARGTYGGPCLRSRAELDQYYTMPEQREALDLWTQNSAPLENYMPALTPKEEEIAEYTNIMNDVNTAVSEYSIQVIMGTGSTENFGKFIDQLNKMNIGKAIEMQQSALDRYNNR